MFDHIFIQAQKHKGNNRLIQFPNIGNQLNPSLVIQTHELLEVKKLIFQLPKHAVPKIQLTHSIGLYTKKQIDSNQCSTSFPCQPGEALRQIAHKMDSPVAKELRFSTFCRLSPQQAQMPE
ncbi:hypothetical protein D3C72_1558710 [compost metagenome]